MESLPKSSLPPFEQELYEKLRNSPLFATYRDAYREATGLPLRAVRADEDWCLGQHHQTQSPFCEQLNRCESACEACISTNKRLMNEAKVEGPTTCGCFAGLCATAVPIRLGATTVAYLKTGQVFHRPPSEEDFARLEKDFVAKGMSEEQINGLREAYFQTRTIDPKRYESMVVLLSTFGEQLSRSLEELATAHSDAEPGAVARARKYIHSNLDSPLPLAEVAKAAGLSESHFCRLFKEVTGQTLTAYVSRCRIDWAKRELLKPRARVSEVAYDVGFQSLSQFNRSFAKIVGCTPSAFRNQRLEEANVGGLQSAV